MSDTSTSVERASSLERRVIAEAIGTSLLLAVVVMSQHVRSGPRLMFSEFIATFGLIAVIWGVARKRPDAVAYAVAGYITAAYWFTPSTSFANPAVTVARALTDTFSGIRPVDVPGFLIAQLVGAACAAALMRWLQPEVRQ